MNKVIEEMTTIFVAIVFLGIILSVIFSFINETKVCEGIYPQGEGVIISNDTYTGLNTYNWNYQSNVDFTTKGACVWTCDEGYKKVGNTCEIIN